MAVSDKIVWGAELLFTEMEQLEELIKKADGYRYTVNIRLSNSHGECYSIIFLDKATGEIMSNPIWGDTLEETISLALVNLC